MNPNLRAWLEYLDWRFDCVEERLSDIAANLGNPIDAAKLDALRKNVDAKRKELARVVKQNQP